MNSDTNDASSDTLEDSFRLREKYKEWKLKDRKNTQALAAHRMGFMSQSAVSQYLLGKIQLNFEALFKFCELFSCKPEEISPSLAQKFERSIPPWLDEDPFAGVPEFEGYLHIPKKIEVEGILEMSDDGTFKVTVATGAGFVESYSRWERVHAVQVKGSKLSPAIRPDWYLVIEPDAVPSAGEYVLAKLSSGQWMVLEFLFKRADSYDLIGVNGQERFNFTFADVEVMSPVGALLPPSKFRARKEA